MSLAPFASFDELDDWLEGDLDTVRADALLAAASTLVRTETGAVWVDAEGALLWEGTEDQKLQLVGEAFGKAVVASAARAYLNPEGLTQKTTGPFSKSFGGDAADGVFLTETEKRSIKAAVAAYRGGASPGIWTLPTTRSRVGVDRDCYVDVVGSDKPLPLDETVDCG